MIKKIGKRLSVFAQDQCGAITVDWVVLTAAIAALGTAVGVSIGTSTKDVADDIGSYIQSTDVMTF